jgi:hypothetical protein
MRIRRSKQKGCGFGEVIVPGSGLQRQTDNKPRHLRDLERRATAVHNQLPGIGNSELGQSANRNEEPRERALEYQSQSTEPRDRNDTPSAHQLHSNRPQGIVSGPRASNRVAVADSEK